MSKLKERSSYAGLYLVTLVSGGANICLFIWAIRDSWDASGWDFVTEAAIRLVVYLIVVNGLLSLLFNVLLAMWAESSSGDDVGGE